MLTTYVKPSLSPDTLTAIAECKDAGNAAFKKGDFQSAVDKYVLLVVLLLLLLLLLLVVLLVMLTLLRRYTAGLALDTTNSILHNNRAAALLKIGDRAAEALVDASEARRLSPEWLKAVHREGECYEQLQVKNT